ncbi:unnamed protein product [Alopecurus aequalis]
MEMNIEDDNFDFDFLTNSSHATSGCSLPSASSSFRSASLSYSTEIISSEAQVLVAQPTGLQFPEVSSLVAPGAVLLPYDDQCVVNFHDTPAAMAPGGMSSTSAFRRYERYLGPQRRLTKPACGQRMFRTAMSVLAKMHMKRRYSHQQQQQAAPSGNQLQHIISERKRREKLNGSFNALKTVLPPGSKKLGQASILIISREYVNSLKSKVCELEEKNQDLQLQLDRRATSAEEDHATEKVEIPMTRAVAEEHPQTGEVCKVKVATPAGGNTTNMMLRILQHLNDQMGEDVRLVSMNTGEDGDRPAQRANLTLHIKSASAVREAGVDGAE